MDETENSEDMFYGYYNLRNFLSHTDNAYQLNIGKSLERSLKYRSGECLIEWSKSLYQFLANGIFARSGLLSSEFETEVGKYMFNDVENVRTVDFWNNAEAATEEINNWISQQTNGKIDPMYSETLDSELAMILVSSLYFKSPWSQYNQIIEFDLITRNAPCWQKSFENTSDCDERVQFMRTEGDFSVVTVNDNGKPMMEVIEIPLENSINRWKTITYNGEEYKNKMQFQIWIPKEEDIRDPIVDKKVIHSMERTRIFWSKINIFSILV